MANIDKNKQKLEEKIEKLLRKFQKKHNIPIIDISLIAYGSSNSLPCLEIIATIGSPS